MTYCVITVKELSDWWGIPVKTASAKILSAWENEDYDRERLRRSGRTYLIDVTLARIMFGEPKNDRPDYN